MIAPKTFLTFCCIFLLTSAVPLIARQETLTPSDLAGTYVYGFRYGGTAIMLNSDGTFTREGSACVEGTTEYGRFTISNNILHFTIAKSLYRRNGVDHLVDLFDAKQREAQFGKDTSEPEREFSLQLVRWSSRMYLMSSDATDRFADLINLGVEPRDRLVTSEYYDAFYLRKDDENKAVGEKPDLPEKSLSRLLKSPITARIIEASEAQWGQLVTIDKGSDDGLKVGMSLAVADVDFDPSIFEVVSVTEHTAKVQVSKAQKVGDKLSTKCGHGCQVF